MTEHNESTVHGDTRFGPTTFDVRRDEPFRRCSFCGSIHPEDLVAARDAGQLWNLAPADWKYGWPHKLYVDVVNPEPEKLFWLGGTSGGPAKSAEDLRAEGYIPVAELTDEQRAICERDGVDPSTYQGVKLDTRSVLHAKFYNVHQAELWVTDELRQALGGITGYVITDAGDGKIRWQAFDYGAAAS